MSKTFDAPLGAGMEHETIFALRQADGWRLYARDCSPDDLGKRLATENLADLERRVIFHHHIHPAARAVFCAQHAHGEGWQQVPNTDIWVPMDEPLPTIPGGPEKGKVSLTLDRICHGILWSVSGGDVKISGFIDEIDDSLVLWTRFVHLLEDGGFPHARLCDHGSTHLIIQAADDPADVRFYVRHYQDGTPLTIDVVTSRTDLVAQFRAFLTAIADHPLLAIAYLCCTEFPEKLVDPVEAAAQREWDDAVAAGRCCADDEAAEFDFLYGRIAAAVPVPEHLVPIVDKVKAMLRTNEVPPNWR